MSQLFALPRTDISEISMSSDHFADISRLWWVRSERVCRKVTSKSTKRVSSITEETRSVLSRSTEKSRFETSNLFVFSKDFEIAFFFLSFIFDFVSSRSAHALFHRAQIFHVDAVRDDMKGLETPAYYSVLNILNVTSINRIRSDFFYFFFLFFFCRCRLSRGANTA